MFLSISQNYPILIAFLLGLLPALIWLWFWLKEDLHPEPAKMLALSFFSGIISVYIVLKIQIFALNHLDLNVYTSFAVFAFIEELLKFIVIYFVALRNKETDEPIDNIIYLIVGALGLATSENIIFSYKSLIETDLITTVISGNLRFIGASLTHVMCSAMIGITLGLSFYKSKKNKILYGISGLIIATVLHTSFNLFIISRAPGNIFVVFGAVWFGIVVLLLLFERIKHIKREEINIKL